MDELNITAIAAKKDERRFEELVRNRKPWILKTASEVSGNYVTDSDDEWSIALTAFHEAVQKYNNEKGSFLSLASVIIKRRVIDYLRSQGKYSTEIAVAPEAFEGDLDDDTACGVNLQVQKRITEDSLGDSYARRAEQAREEIGEMQEILNAYGFSFFDLAEASPKAEKTRISCGKAVRTLVITSVLMALMRLKRLLPIKELSEKSGVIRKILERHRKYIIASAEILDGDFPILSSYLKNISEE